MLHSVVEFGLHIPAIAVLAAVVCGQLCALGGQRDDVKQGAGRWAVWTPGPARAYCMLGGMAAVLLGFLLVAEAWRTHRSERLRFIAQQNPLRDDIPALQQRIRWLQAAVRLAPENAEGHLDLAHAHLDLHEAKKKELAQFITLADAAETVLALAPAGICDAGVTNMAVSMTAALAPGAILGERLAKERAELRRRYAIPALGYLVLARDANPMVADCHIELAVHASWLEEGNSAAVYREARPAPRSCGARRLVPLWLARAVLEPAE